MSDTTREILNLYRRLDPERKKEFMSLVKAIAEPKPIRVRQEARHE